MKRLFIFVAVLVLFGACHRRNNAASTTTNTETIAPANAQPAQTGTDALTQTTDIEDSRSEEDGGVTSPTAGATDTTATTAKPAKAAKAPAKKKHK